MDMQSYELCCDMIDVVIDVSCIYGLTSGDETTPAFDRYSQASIRLNNGTILHLREVNRFLALVCILGDNALEKQGNETEVMIIRCQFECDYKYSGCFRHDRL